MLGGIGIITIKKRGGEKYQGISRPQPREGKPLREIQARLPGEQLTSGVTAERVENTEKGGGEEKRKTHYSPLEEEQATGTRRTNKLSASHGARRLNEAQILRPNAPPVKLKAPRRHCGTVKSLPCRPSQNKRRVSAIMNELRLSATMIISLETVC